MIYHVPLVHTTAVSRFCWGARNKTPHTNKKNRNYPLVNCTNCALSPLYVTPSSAISKSMYLSSAHSRVASSSRSIRLTGRDSACASLIALSRRCTSLCWSAVSRAATADSSLHPCISSIASARPEGLNPASACTPSIARWRVLMSGFATFVAV